MVIKRRSHKEPDAFYDKKRIITTYAQYRKFLWDRQGGTRFVGRSSSWDGIPILNVPNGGDMVYIDPRANDNFRDVLHVCNKATAFTTVALLTVIGRDEIHEIHMDGHTIRVKFFAKYEPRILEGQPLEDRVSYRGI